jgi:hypothetical protein
MPRWRPRRRTWSPGKSPAVERDQKEPGTQLGEGRRRLLRRQQEPGAKQLRREHGRTNCARLRRCFRGHPRDGLRHRDALRADSAVTDPRALVGAARPPPGGQPARSRLCASQRSWPGWLPWPRKRQGRGSAPAGTSNVSAMVACTAARTETCWTSASSFVRKRQLTSWGAQCRVARRSCARTRTRCRPRSWPARLGV